MEALEGTVGHVLVGVGRAHRNRAAEALARIGLYVGQEWILLRLRAQEGMTPSELAESCAVEGPTISKALRRMERAGLVERHEDPTDARVSRVYLTDKGTARCRVVDEIWSDLEQRTVANLSAEERILLRRLLLQVQRDLE
ncbi:MAG TPA: MarR family transcriptional regulator [Chloroflexota bacterium]|nr:MarR family transcriptional regulator [Chloroflexota bacterium]